jgi:hypothetical protein
MKEAYVVTVMRLSEAERGQNSIVRAPTRADRHRRDEGGASYGILAKQALVSYSYGVLDE